MKKFTLSLDEKIHSEVKILSVLKGKSMQELIIEAIEQFTQNQKK